MSEYMKPTRNCRRQPDSKEKTGSFTLSEMVRLVAVLREKENALTEQIAVMEEDGRGTGFYICTRREVHDLLIKIMDAQLKG